MRSKPNFLPVSTARRSTSMVRPSMTRYCLPPLSTIAYFIYYSPVIHFAACPRSSFTRRLLTGKLGGFTNNRLSKFKSAEAEADEIILAGWGCVNRHVKLRNGSWHRLGTKRLSVDKILAILYPHFMPDLSLIQRQIIESPFDSKLFVSGPAGTGKTLVGVERMRFLLAAGVPADSILMLTPQRTLQEPYLDLLYSPERTAGGEVTSATIGGLARRTVDLFWPIAAEAAGFANPDRPPIFLSLETSQYYMAHIVRPLLDEGYFESVTMDRNRLYSQILDNLNKAAIVGFPHTEIASRLDAAYFGDPAQRRVYADAQECAIRFREYCLQNNLLDFSLQLEIFSNILWPLDIVRDYLMRTYRHLIYDNVEEDSPRAHDIIRTWLPEFESALLIYDEGGGYRHFLGSDPLTGYALNQLCDEQVVFDESFVMSEHITNLASSLEHIILPDASISPPEAT